MKKSSLKWVAVGAVLGGIVIGGAGVYGWVALSDGDSKVDNKVTNESEDQSNPTNQPDERLVAQDDRILVTLDNVSEHSVDDSGARKCQEDFRSHTAEANETKTYSNSEYGFSVELPYNADWGSDLYRLNPFDERTDPIDDGTGDVLATVQFGQMFVGEGCGWYRTHVLNVRKPRTVAQIEAEVSQSAVINKPVTASSIPGLAQEAVEYDTGGLCGQPTVEVVGEEFNLVLYAMCASFVEEDYPPLRAVAASLVLE